MSMMNLTLMVKMIIAFALALLLLQHSADAQQIGRYNPCNKPGRVARGAGFVVGVALWPGGTLDDWGLSFNTTDGVNQPGWSPCRTLTVNNTEVLGRDYLASKGVLFASYAVVTDTLTSISLFWHDLERAWASIPDDGNHVLSAVVFRGALRSEPVYIRSENTTLTQGNGTATLLSFVARFEGGELAGFDWMAGGCQACGGFDSRQCISASLGTTFVQETCAAPTSPDCTLDTTPLQLPRWNASAPWATCRNVTLYMGFVGDDAKQRVLRSGYQVARVGRFSLSSTIDRLTKAITEALTRPADLFNQSDSLIAADNGLA